MKSAYELAMERLGGTQSYTDEQKTRLAEIDKRYQAKEAEIRLRADDQVKKAGDDPEKVKAAREALARDMARLTEKREAEKNAVRTATKP